MLKNQHKNNHDFLLYTYDILRDMVVQSDEKDLIKTTFDFASSEEMQSFDNTEDIIKWLDNNNHHQEALFLFKGKLFFYILNDFCMYLYESLSCIKRNKVTVAYTLLRKPIKDSLLYLEWLLSDVEGFFYAFHYDNIRSYDISSFQPEMIKKIINSASDCTYMGNLLNPNNMLYMFRFDRGQDIGLQRIWDQSIHIVTRNKNYQTEQENLNFIFSQDMIWDSYWNYYYLVLPHIMAYVLEICEALFLEYNEVSSVDLSLNRLIRMHKFTALKPAHLKFINLPSPSAELYRMLDIASQHKTQIYFVCESCGQRIVLDKILLKQMLDNFYYACPHCDKKNSVCKYIVDTIIESSI